MSDDAKLIETVSTHRQIHSYAREEDVNVYLAKMLGPRFVEYRRQWDLAGRFELETEFPLFLVLELINTCNYRCPSCVHGYKDLRNLYQAGRAQEMPVELFERIVLEAEEYGCPSVCVNNIGEPTLMKDLLDRIEYLRNHGFIDIMFNTNGLLLDRFLSPRLFESGVTRVMFSLDAYTAETYSKTRVGGDFERVLRNLDWFMEMRARGHYKLPIVRTTMVRSALNEHEVDDFVRYWTGRVDYVSIQEFISPRPGDARFDRLFATSRVIQENPQCPQPWQYMSVKPNGKVAPCCSMFSDLIAVGDVTTTPLRTIWTSDYFRFLRRIHKEGRYVDDPTCKMCFENSVARLT